MEDSRIYLLPDCQVQNESDKLWMDYIIKYLSFGLSQKGFYVKVLKDFNDPFEEDGIVVYLPVFSTISLLSQDFKTRLENTLSSSKVLKFGLIKEEKIFSQTALAYPDLKLAKLFLLDPETGREVPEKDLFKKEYLNYFLFKVYDLCNELERIISEKSIEINTEEKDTKALYLAESTPDLISVREEIRRELLQLGYKVYPEVPLVGSAQDKEKVINSLIKKCSLSVHLFGKLYEEASEGIPNYDLENRTTAAYYISKVEGKEDREKFKRIIWLPDNLNVQSEKQAKYLSQIHKEKKYYAGADIIKSSVEELKDIIIENLTTKQELSGESGGNSSGSGSNQPIVYIVNSEKNKEGAETVRELLEGQGFEVYLNKITIDKAKIEKSNSVLFYYHNEKSSWLRSKMCELYKLKSWEYSSTSIKRGVINFQNEELPNDEIFRNVYQIKAEEKLNQENLTSFFNSSF